MTACVIEHRGDEVIIAVTIKVHGPMSHTEEAILAAANGVGAVAEALKQFDADSEPITLGGVKLQYACYVAIFSFKNCSVVSVSRYAAVALRSASPHCDGHRTKSSFERNNSDLRSPHR
jgi:hypothetical protein